MYGGIILVSLVVVSKAGSKMRRHKTHVRISVVRHPTTQPRSASRTIGQSMQLSSALSMSSTKPCAKKSVGRYTNGARPRLATPRLMLAMRTQTMKTSSATMPLSLVCRLPAPTGGSGGSTTARWPVPPLCPLDPAIRRKPWCSTPSGPLTPSRQPTSRIGCRCLGQSPACPPSPPCQRRRTNMLVSPASSPAPCRHRARLVENCRRHSTHLFSMPRLAANP